MKNDHLRLDKLIAERVERARQAAGLSVETVAGQIGMASSCYRALELGNTRFGSVIVCKLAKTLNVEIRSFFDPANDATGTVADILATTRQNTRLWALMNDVAVHDEAA